MSARIRVTLLIAISLLVAWTVIAKSPGAGPGEQVRQAAVAGAFYPADPKELAATVDGFLVRVSVPSQKGQVIALIAPHAGYPFSGAVAAHSYALLKGRPTHRVVVIAPSHYETFPFASIYEGDAYATPLGPIAVDKEFARKLARSNPEIKLSSRGHVPSPDGAEHSLEVQLPFLQRTRLALSPPAKNPGKGQTVPSKTLSDRGHSHIQWAGDQDVASSLRSRQKFCLDIPFYRTH